MQALALVGYCGPTLGRGPAVLALDGGGIRGLIAIEVLRHLERLTGRRVNDLFDYIIGVSTGAIIAAVIGQCTQALSRAREHVLALPRTHAALPHSHLIGLADEAVSEVHIQLAALKKYTK